MIASSEATDTLRNGWADAAAALAPDVPELVDFLQARLDEALVTGRMGEDELLTAVDEVASIAGRAGSPAGTALARRLRRTVYEYLLALDASQAVDQRSEPAALPPVPPPLLDAAAAVPDSSAPVTEAPDAPPEPQPQRRFGFRRRHGQASSDSPSPEAVVDATSGGGAPGQVAAPPEVTAVEEAAASWAPRPDALPEPPMWSFHQPTPRRLPAEDEREGGEAPPAPPLLGDLSPPSPPPWYADDGPDEDRLAGVDTGTLSSTAAEAVDRPRDPHEKPAAPVDSSASEAFAGAEPAGRPLSGGEGVGPPPIAADLPAVQMSDAAVANPAPLTDEPAGEIAEAAVAADPLVDDPSAADLSPDGEPADEPADDPAPPTGDATDGVIADSAASLDSASDRPPKPADVAGAGFIVAPRDGFHIVDGDLHPAGAGAVSPPSTFAVFSLDGGAAAAEEVPAARADDRLRVLGGGDSAPVDAAGHALAAFDDEFDDDGTASPQHQAHRSAESPRSAGREDGAAVARPGDADDPFEQDAHLADTRRRIQEKLRRKRCDEAAALLQLLAQEAGGRVVAELAMDAGDRCRALGKTNAALNCYLAASRSDPVYELPLSRLADICIDDQDPELAVSYLERIARLARMRGDEKGALRVYRRIATVAPYREDVLALLMNAHRAGRLDP